MATLDEYNKLLDQIKLLLADAKSLSSSEIFVLQRSLNVIKYIIEQELLNSRLIAMTDKRLNRQQLIEKIDKKLKEYQEVAKTWKDGSKANFVPYESKTLEKLETRINELTKLRETLLKKDYKADIEEFIAKLTSKREHTITDVLCQCASMLSDTYGNLPEISGRTVLKLGKRPELIQYTDFEIGYSQSQNIDKVLSKETIDILYFLLSHVDQMRVIIEMGKSKHAADNMEWQLKKDEEYNKALAFCSEHVNELIKVRELIGWDNHGKDAVHEYWNKIGRKSAELSSLSKNAFSKFLNSSKIAKIKEEMAKMQADYKFLFKDDNAVSQLERGVGVVHGAQDKEIILKRLEKGKVDTKTTEELIAKEKNRVNQLVANIDPTIQEALKKDPSLWYTLYRYLDSYKKYKTPKLVAILILKAISDTYQLSIEDITKLVESSAQEEIDKLAGDFEKLMAKRDNTYIIRYDEQAEEPIEAFPGSSR